MTHTLRCSICDHVYRRYDALRPRLLFENLSGRSETEGTSHPGVAVPRHKTSVKTQVLSRHLSAHSTKGPEVGSKEFAI